MPIPNSPPFVAGALTSPRQLNRWLDKNPQGGALTRAGYTLTIPSFNVNYSWLGYSDIVLAIDYASPNNFVLQNFPAQPLNLDFTLCISYVNADLSVVRYRLWTSANEVIYGFIPPYNGECIKKNFRFEVWSTSLGNAVLTQPIVSFTSVLQNYDYRFASDLSLTTGTSKQGFSSNLNLPFNFNNAATVNTQ